MHQLIARIDDDLKARLKAKAAAEGRSLNSVVTDALQAALGVDDVRAGLFTRLTASGKRIVPTRPTVVPSAATVDRATKGAGTATSEALAAERKSR